MEFFRKAVTIIKKPFPDDLTLWAYAKISIVLSLFVTFFLFIFQPFGLSTLQSDTFLICLGFGSMTFVGAMLYELSIGQLLRFSGWHTHWTFGKWIINTLGSVIFISLANFVFARLIIFGSIDWTLFPIMLYSTFMIGVLPVTTLGAWMVYQQENKYRGIAHQINQVQTSPTHAKTEKGATLFEIPLHQIKYVEALQNYVKIGHIDTDGNLKIQTERVTLKGVLSQTEGSAIVKCHRSFLVNKDAIVNASGNAQGLLLSLSDCDKVIPVSRTCVPLFR